MAISFTFNPFTSNFDAVGENGESVATYPTFSSFPATAPDGSLALALDTDVLYAYSATAVAWVAIGGPGAALSIGTFDSGTASSNGAHIDSGQLIMQSASASKPGLVNTTTQSFAGNKTFTGTIGASNLSGTNSGDVTIGTANGLSLSSQVLSLAQATNSLPGAVANVGGANGVAPLDSGSKIPVAYLPSTVMLFLGNWNASTNTPTLADGTGTNGDVYRTSVAGTQNLGSGPQSFLVGDFVIYNGTVWQKAPAADGVQSVNGLQGAVVLTQGNLTDAGTDGITVTNGTNAVWGTGTSLSQHVADTTHNGYLSSTDWNTFNNKQPTITTGNLTDVGTDGITITNGVGAVIGTGTSISQHVADATHSGYLSTTDWNTFNGKQTAGNYITALTGDVTATGPGSVAATLATVNTNTGSFGSSTAIPSFTVNGKGLITAASSNAVIAPASTLSGSTLASGVTGSSLTSVGTITTGVWNGTPIAIANGGTGQTGAAAAFNALAPGTSTGGLIYGNGTNTYANLGIGSTGNILTVSGGAPAWAPLSVPTTVGFNYLSSNTSVYGGTNSTLSFTGTDNAVIGVGAGASLTTGLNNVFLGYNAANAATTVGSSVVIGNNALGVGVATSTGGNLVVIGSNAGKALTTGVDNVLIGTNAGDIITTGGTNTIVGYQSPSVFSAGISNLTAIGYRAGGNTATPMTGAKNTLLGALSGFGMDTGANNTFVGYQAAGSLSADLTGSFNVALGSNSGLAISSGSDNVFIGYQASQGVTTGGDNVAIGYQANVNSAVAAQAKTIVIGSTANASGSQAIILGYGASDNGAANSIILGQAEPASSSHTGSFLVGQTTDGSLATTTTAANQITFGTAGAHAIPLKDMFIGRGAIGDGTATNASIQPSPTVGANIAGANLTITAGNGTGSGGSGNINFQTAPVAGASSTPNTFATVLSLSKTGAVSFSGASGSSGQALFSNGASAAPSWASVTTASSGDIAETSFAASNNISSPANVTGLAFANATVRSAKILLSVYVNATSSLYQAFDMLAIQRGSDWQIYQTASGDNSGFVFTITSAGQIQYTNSNYTGFSAATIKFRAMTTSV